MTFCAEQPIPVSEDALLLFTTYLAQQHLSYAAIQVYLLAVKYNQIIAGKSLPLVTPQLNYVLKHSAAIINYSKDRLPITFPIMACIHAALSKHPSSYRDVMPAVSLMLDF